MRIPTVPVLSEDEIETIHCASLEILRDVGVKVMSGEILDLLAQAGAVVDFERQMARFPLAFTEKHLAGLKGTVRIWNRSRTDCITLGDGHVHCASGHNAIYMQEFGSSVIRDATKEDVAQLARLTDALDNLEVAGIVLMPRNVQEQASLVHAVDAMFNNTTKHVFFAPGFVEEAISILDIARVACEATDLSERPVLTCQVSPTSPLTWETGAVLALAHVARAGVPLSFLPGPMGGAACPYTLAGHLAQYNAEMLSGIVISQTVRPGTPVLYGGGWSIFDMRESIAKIASPESVLLRMAGVQMARRYGVPCHCMGMDSDSHTYDEQMGMEKMLTTTGTYLAGADLVVNGGMYSSGVTASLEQLVIDDEVSGQLRRFMAGIEFTSEKLAMDVIRDVGPGGEFLSHEHTMEFLRSGEHRLNELPLRLPIKKWLQQDRPDIMVAARDKVRALMARHCAEPLDSAAKKEIAGIISRFEREYT